MSTDNNIKTFTAADIEKYHQGLLSNKERHDLEKAAMDDPFLADALEGYAVAGVNAGADIAALKKRLTEKVEGAKVIPMKAAPRNSFRTLRAAAMIAFVAGASFLIYQFGFKNKSSEIAQAETTKKQELNPSDTTKNNTPTTVVPELRTIDNNTAPIKNEISKPRGNIQNNASGGSSITPEQVVSNDAAVSKSIETQPVANAPLKTLDEKSDDYKVTNKNAVNKELAKAETENKQKSRQDSDGDGVKDQLDQQNSRNITASRKADNAGLYNNTNIFRGRVTDANNNAVPFANVTNVQDNNVGTYTDASGYFNLTYPDSVLNVQVRSIGFENNNVLLRNTVNNNQVIMQDDRRNLSEVVLNRQKPNAIARSRDSNMKLEEPEPADGWANYDTYLANNLEVPEDLKSRQTGSGEVLVSFEVDKNGEPVNIKVEKSLCGKCDKEAIRLIKEGPKWKRKAKKGRTTVTIYF